MTADNFTTVNERVLSGVAALATHALFLVLLVFSLTWQKRLPEQAVVAEIWSNLPPFPAPKVDPAPEVKPEPTPPKPEPAPKAQVKPVPKADPKPPPKAEPKPTAKPDIALQDKKEKERKAAEQALAETKKREQEEALRKLAAQQQAKEAEAKQRAAREQEEALKKAAARQASDEAKQIAEYERRIGERIKRFIQEPPNLQGNPAVQFEIIIFPGGEVQAVKTIKSSGQSAWDNAVERAILKATPLPIPPPESAIARHFRTITPVFKPKE